MESIILCPLTSQLVYVCSVKKSEAHTITHNKNIELGLRAKFKAEEFKHRTKSNRWKKRVDKMCEDRW
jgi:hypothetical protein